MQIMTAAVQEAFGCLKYIDLFLNCGRTVEIVIMITVVVFVTS